MALIYLSNGHEPLIYLGGARSGASPTSSLIERWQHKTEEKASAPTREDALTWGSAVELAARADARTPTYRLPLVRARCARADRLTASLADCLICASQLRPCYTGDLVSWRHVSDVSVLTEIICCNYVVRTLLVLLLITVPSHSAS